MIAATDGRVVGGLLLWSLVVAVIDWRWRRVPNGLLLLMLGVMLSMQLWRGLGPLQVEPVQALAGLACGLLLTLPGYLLSRLGAGDVKLAAVIGGLLGWPHVLWGLLAAALLLGAMSLSVLAVMGLAQARALRLPAAVALVGGFVAVMCAAQEGWL